MIRSKGGSIWSLNLVLIGTNRSYHPLFFHCFKGSTSQEVHMFIPKFAKAWFLQWLEKNAQRYSKAALEGRLMALKAKRDYTQQQKEAKKRALTEGEARVSQLEAQATRLTAELQGLKTRHESLVKTDSVAAKSVWKEAQDKRGELDTVNLQIQTQTQNNHQLAQVLAVAEKVATTATESLIQFESEVLQAKRRKELAELEAMGASMTIHQAKGHCDTLLEAIEQKADEAEDSARAAQMELDETTAAALTA